MMTSWEAQQELIKEAASKLPERFGNPGFPGDEFSILPLDSYVRDDGTVMLYVGIWLGGKCEPFAKGTLAEVRANSAPIRHGEVTS